MLYSGSLLLRSGALGKVPETFRDRWGLPTAAWPWLRCSKFRWRWEKCGVWDSSAASHRDRPHGSTSDVAARLFLLHFLAALLGP